MSMQLLSDNELVKLYMNGNEESLSILVKRHKRRIFSYLYLISRNKELTEDIFQETFFKVIQTLKKRQYNEEGKFLPWVLRIAKNLMIDHFRKIKKMPSISSVTNDEGERVDIFDIIPEPTSNSKDANETKEFKELIRNVVGELPPDQKEVVIMRTYYDMSFKEIAEVTDVSINTALGRMRYALINLKKMLEEKNVEVFI
jgi:RNA polymerase sigma-70 factor (ECF subfamily)